MVGLYEAMERALAGVDVTDWIGESVVPGLVRDRLSRAMVDRPGSGEPGPVPLDLTARSSLSAGGSKGDKVTIGGSACGS